MGMIQGYTIKDAADMTGISKAAMHKRVLRGTMKAEKINGVWNVYLDDKTASHDKKASGNDELTILSMLQKQLTEKDVQIEFLKDELHRKDTIIMSLTERIPRQLKAPTRKSIWNRIRHEKKGKD